MSIEKSLSFTLLLLLCFGSNALTNEIYYISLGDSYAAGVRFTGPPPGKMITPAYSYADALYEMLSTNYNNLVLVKYACSGITSDGLIHNGKKCHGNGLSQLDKAVEFMKSNSGKVKFVTINVGVNDLHHCNVNDNACISSKIKNVTSNLNSTIIPMLKEAGGEGVIYAGSTYYAKFTSVLDDTLIDIYRGNGFKVADLRTIFDTNGKNVEFEKRVCLYTNLCNGYKDTHPNFQGSRAIGNLFYNELGN